MACYAAFAQPGNFSEGHVPHPLAGEKEGVSVREVVRSKKGAPSLCFQPAIPIRTNEPLPIGLSLPEDNEFPGAFFIKRQ